MIKKINWIIVFSALMGLATWAVAAEKTSAIMLKAGDYSLDSTDQTVFATSITFDEDVSSEYSLEYEYRINKKVGVGVEYISHTEKYSVASSSGEVESSLLIVNARRYYSFGKNVKTFFGAGVGLAVADLSGPIIGDATGMAMQGMIGVEFPFDSFGLLAEYKYVYAKPEDGIDEKVDISGSGLFAGVVIHF